jgi:probable rRNA maturation factor
MKGELNKNFKGRPGKKFIDKLFTVIGRHSPRFKRGEVSVAVVNDATIKKLNNIYRHKNSVTDVLSFAERDAPAIYRKPGPYLGEIIISYPQAVRQARANKHSVQKEVAFLIVHGCLHLIGHDHARPDSARRMRAAEQKILNKFFL